MTRRDSGYENPKLFSSSFPGKLEHSLNKNMLAGITPQKDVGTKTTVPADLDPNIAIQSKENCQTTDHVVHSDSQKEGM